MKIIHGKLLILFGKQSIFTLFLIIINFEIMAMGRGEKILTNSVFNKNEFNAIVESILESDNCKFEVYSNLWLYSPTYSIIGAEEIYIVLCPSNIESSYLQAYNESILAYLYSNKKLSLEFSQFNRMDILYKGVWVTITLSGEEINFIYDNKLKQTKNEKRIIQNIINLIKIHFKINGEKANSA